MAKKSLIKFVHSMFKTQLKMKQIDNISKIPGTGCRVPDTGYWIPGTGCRVPDTGYWIPNQGTNCGLFDAF